MKRSSTPATAALLLSLLASPAMTQTPAAMPTVRAAPAAAIDERALVAEISKLVRERYVVPEKRAAIASRLQQALASGRYGVEDPQELVRRVSEDMREASDDGHMYILHDPERAVAMSQPRVAADENAFDDVWVRRAERGNHGVAELKILEGNIRYLNLTGFFWVDDRSRQALEDAMRFLSGGEAVIIDIRGAPGGSPDAVQYVTSHFVEPGRHLIDFQMRDGRTTSRAVAGALPAGRMLGKPLYVLTGRGTGSAAEEFAYHVASFKLGELVGATTAGAAHRNALIPAGQGFIASISEGRPIHPVTGGNWERKGVAATMATPLPAALHTAHMDALEKLAAKPGPEQSRYAFLVQSVRARVSPAALAAAPEAYAGRYGERVITAEGGGLSYRRADGPKSRLLPVSGDRFVLESDPGAHIRVRLEGGKAAGIEVLRDDGTRSAYQRTADS